MERRRDAQLRLEKIMERQNRQPDETVMERWSGEGEEWSIKAAWRWLTAAGHTRITGRKALHYVLLFRYNHRTAITPRRHRGAGTDTRIDAPETQGSCNTINNTIKQRGPVDAVNSSY
ncbi:hypothetical protein F7725_024916 [Dissostichus mawsoni]|uniref:Uncharacterized protein n=1 Tax=Dissostichus mawsoni TaxID=36200 RepID=A0A7J5X9P5_DISMA|nr:hypothetical protein F7725_024916 [Dissostichus mawsoni]